MPVDLRVKAIGGPFDGQWVDYNETPWFTVRIATMNNSFSMDDDTPRYTVTEHRYYYDRGEDGMIYAHYAPNKSFASETFL